MACPDNCSCVNDIADLKNMSDLVEARFDGCHWDAKTVEYAGNSTVDCMEKVRFLVSTNYPWPERVLEFVRRKTIRTKTRKELLRSLAFSAGKGMHVRGCGGDEVWYEFLVFAKELDYFPVAIEAKYNTLLDTLQPATLKELTEVCDQSGAIHHLVMYDEPEFGHCFVQVDDGIEYWVNPSEYKFKCSQCETTAIMSVDDARAISKPVCTAQPYSSKGGWKDVYNYEYRKRKHFEALNTISDLKE